MSQRKSRSVTNTVQPRGVVAKIQPSHAESTGEAQLAEVAVDPSLPLVVQMTAWEVAFNALVLIPMAVTMFFSAAPLLVANVFTRQTVPPGVTAN